jgi:hypothetical protein
MRITLNEIQQIIREELDDMGRDIDPLERDRFPETAASNDELLHSDIVSSIYDTIIDTALLNAGKDRENIVLTGIDNELESREMDGEEVDMSPIDLQQVFRDVMLEIERAEQRSLKEEMTPEFMSMTQGASLGGKVFFGLTEARAGLLEVLESVEVMSFHREAQDLGLEMRFQSVHEDLSVSLAVLDAAIKKLE